MMCVFASVKKLLAFEPSKNYPKFLLSEGFLLSNQPGMLQLTNQALPSLTYHVEEWNFTQKLRWKNSGPNWQSNKKDWRCKAGAQKQKPYLKASNTKYVFEW